MSETIGNVRARVFLQPQRPASPALSRRALARRLSVRVRAEVRVLMFDHCGFQGSFELFKARGVRHTERLANAA